MADEGVSYVLLNARRVKDACRIAKDDECVICGWFRCLECGEQDMDLQPIPDWAHSLPGKIECPTCHKMEAVLVLTDDFVRIPSRRQGETDGSEA